MRKTGLGLVSVAALVAISAPASAASILADGGFESQGASTNNYCYFGFAAAGNSACGSGAWTGRDSGGGQAGPGGSGFQFEGNGAWPGLASPDGTRYAFIQMTGSISQSFTATQSGNYALSWLEAGRPRGCCGGNQRYLVEIGDGVNLAPLLYSGATFTNQPWTARQGDFSVHLTAGAAYTLSFRGLESVTDQTSFIDAVSLDLAPGGAVPEPASWALMLGGFGLVGAAMRRRGGAHTVTA
jgi:PEP-CTERM motif